MSNREFFVWLAVIAIEAVIVVCLIWQQFQ
jgi:heme exporter protein D